MTSYLCWEPKNGAAKAEGYLRMEPKKMLAQPSSHLHAAISIGLPSDETRREEGLPWMEFAEEQGYCSRKKGSGSASSSIPHKYNKLMWLNEYVHVLCD